MAEADWTDAGATHEGRGDDYTGVEHPAVEGHDSLGRETKTSGGKYKRRKRIKILTINSKKD